MTSFLVTAPDGRKLKISGDTMPSEQELDEIFEVTGTKQSVMDDRDGKVYNMPVNMDGLDATFAIDTQHKGKKVDSFFGKVEFDGQNMFGDKLTKMREASNKVGQKIVDAAKSAARGVIGGVEGLVDTAIYNITDQDQNKRIAAGKTFNPMRGANPAVEMDTVWELPTEENRELAKQAAENVQKIRDNNKEKFTKAKENIKPEKEMDDLDRWFEGLGNGAFSVLGSIGAAVTLKNPEVAAGSMAALYGRMRQIEFLDEADAAGMDYDKAYALSVGAGAIEGGLEFVGDKVLFGISKIKPIQDLTNKVITEAAIKMAQKKAGKEAIKKIGTRHANSVFGAFLKGGTTEAFEEGLQESLGMIYDNLAGVQDYEASDIIGQTLLAASTAFVTGGVAGGGGQFIYNRSVRGVNDNIKAALQKVEPELNETELQVTADALQEIFFQHGGEYVKELNNVLGKEISTQSMPENLTPESLTAETRKFLKEKYNMSDEEINKTVQAGVNLIDIRSQYAEAYNLFRDGLELSGRDMARADGEARILAARAVALAREEGKNVKDILDRWGLKFQQMKFADFYRDHEGQLRNPKDLEMLSRDAFNDLKNFKEGKELKGQSLLAFIKSRGGLKDTGGELKAMDADKSYVGLINNKNGNGLDDMTQTLWDAGYFVGEERPTINQLLDAISEELQGKKRYSMNQDVQASRMDEMKNLADELARIGVDIDLDSYGTVNLKMREAYEASQKTREAAEFYDLSEDQQERYAMMRDNGASHEQAMAAVQNGADDEIQFQMVGPKALTAALDELDRAKQLEADGVDNEEIRQQTGWFKGVDGKWRFEISDKDAEFNEAYDPDRIHKEGLFFDDIFFKLGKVLKHDKLFAAYPELKDLNFVYTKRMEQDADGNYDPATKTIYIKSGLNSTMARYVLMHEIQHAIQHIEGFAFGGSLVTIDELKQHYKGIIEDYDYSPEMQKLERDLDELEFLYDAVSALEVAENPEKVTKKGWWQENVFGSPKGKARKEFIEEKAQDFINYIKDRQSAKSPYKFSRLLEYLQEGNLKDLKAEMRSLQSKVGRKMKKSYPEAYKDAKVKLYNLEDSSAFEIYKRLAGEIEARNTQARMDMSDEERRATSPESTQDIKNADAIVVFSDGTAMAYGPKAADYFADGENKIYDNVITDHQRKGLIEAAPEKFAGTTKDDLRKVLKMDENGVAKIKSPIEEIKIQEQHLDHLLNDNEPQRKTFLNYVVATIERPNLVVRIGNKNHYIKFFINKSKIKPHLQIVKVASDGSFYVTNYRPTKKQVNDTIKEGQIVYNLSNVRDGDVSSSVANSISQNGGNVKRGDVKDLYATHNMSLAGVKDALKLGGLAMPSLAMRKVGQGDINQFGDIVFVANERLASPSRSSDVYDRDAWTPNLSYAIKYDLSAKANTFIKKVLEKAGQPERWSVFRYNIEENLGNPKSDTMGQELYEIDKGLEDNKYRGNDQEYLDWYEEHFGDGEPYLWTENDSNTDMVRRKFTLDNMMKILRKQEKSGGGFIGDYIFDVYKLLNFKAQKFKNLKEVKKNKDKLVSREEQRQALEQLNDDFLALAEDLKKEGVEYDFGAPTYGLGIALVQETDARISESLQRRNLQSDDAAVKKVKDFAKRMENIPTDYFEVKPRRKVDFSEFSGVIIPEGKQYDEVARALERDHYLNVERVEKGNEEQYDQALRNIQANSETVFFQNQGRTQGTARGAYANNIIYLFEHADASTVIHEMAHFFLDDMRKYATSEKTKEQLKAIYDYLGATNGDLTYEQNEYFADSFEVYLMEGKAPNQLLAKVFARFKKWMRMIWSEVKRLNNVKLTDEMRKTFDEMLGGRSLDFAMQMGGQKMTNMSQSGYISPTIAQRAVDLLKAGKMSRADMDDILERLKTGELARADVAAELKKFEESNVKNNEQLNPFDTVKYKEALLKDNVNKTKVMEKIERLMEWAKPKEVNGRTVGRFPDKKMNDFFIEVAKEMSLDKEEAKKRIAENKGIISAILQSAPLPEMERNTILGMRISENDRPELLNALALENRVLSVAAKNISLDNTVKLYNDLQDSYNLGRLTANVTGDLKKARKNRMISDAIRVLVGVGNKSIKQERSEITKRLNRFGSSMMSWNGLMDILSMNDKQSSTGMSELSKMMDVFECEQAEANGIAADGEELSRLFEKKIAGLGNSGIAVSKYINNELDKKSTIEWDSYKQTFTKDELIDIYMKAKDKETREIMIHDEIKGYNESFLAVVNQNLTAEDRAFGDALFEFYNENWKKINAFYEEKYGVTMPKNDYYSPRSINREGISVSTGDMMAYAASGFTKKRTAKIGATVDIQGAFKVWNNYAVKTNRWLAWSDKLVDINSVFGNVEVKDTIERLFGSAMNARIRSEVERMAGGDQNKFFNSPLITKIRSNYARSVLALKPALMIKQLTSFPAYWNEMSAKDFAEGLADFFAHPKEAMEILGNTTLMKTRGTDIIRDFAVISKMDVLKGKKGIKWSDAIMLNIKLGDRGAIYMGGWALYKSELKKNLAKGMKEEDAKAKALERFERVTDETQQSGRLSQQSFWQSNPALRMFTMFQSSQNQYLRKEIAAVRGVLTGRMDKTQAAKQLFIFHVLLPCLFQLASDGFDWDKDAQLRAAIIGSLNGVFVLSKILEKIYDKVVLDKGAFNSRSLGVREVVPFWGSMEDLVKEFEKLADGDVDLTDAADAFEAFSKTAKAGGELSGVPLKYPLDVIKNFGSYAEEGEYAKEIMLWLGWSPYALRDDDE